MKEGSVLPKTWKQILPSALKATMPVLAGYLVLGMGFGILLHAKGYGAGWALGMSAFIYAGSMQYLTIDLLAGGASLIAAALTTLMVNARHLFYGVSMIESYRGMGAKKPYAIFALTDETYSLVCQNGEHAEREDRHRYCLCVSLLNHLYWISGSVLGALLGSVLPFSVEGIDFALTALFVTVFVEQWLSTKDHLPALIGAAASVGCLAVFGPDSFLIPAMLVILISMAVLRALRGEAER